MRDEGTAYFLTEEDRQLLLKGIAELAASDPELTHKLTHAAYRLQGIVAFEEYHQVAKAKWQSLADIQVKSS